MRKILLVLNEVFNFVLIFQNPVSFLKGLNEFMKDIFLVVTMTYLRIQDILKVISKISIDFIITI